MSGKEFGEWLDRHEVGVGDAAVLFGVSEGSIYKWRSSLGVPPRKLEWVRLQMASHERRAAASGSLDRLVLEVTDQQLRSYIEAAAHEGIYFKDWAVKTLDRAAESDGDDGEGDTRSADTTPITFPRAAEDDGPGYSTKSRDAG